MINDLLTLYYKWSLILNRNPGDLSDKKLNKILSSYLDYKNNGGKRRNTYLDEELKKRGIALC